MDGLIRAMVEKNCYFKIFKNNVFGKTSKILSKKVVNSLWLSYFTLKNQETEEWYGKERYY